MNNPDQPKPTTGEARHSKDCHLGDNWKDCPACVESYQATADQPKPRKQDAATPTIGECTCDVDENDQHCPNHGKEPAVEQLRKDMQTLSKYDKSPLVEPTTGEHQFRLSKRHIGECEVCGRPEAAHHIPATGAWTPESVKALVGYDIGGSGTIARAHNAEIAAEGEQWQLAMEESHRIISRKNEELDAAREKGIDTGGLVEAARTIKQLREQLDVERGATEQYKTAFENANDTCKQLREQLAAEREHVSRLQRLEATLQEQLAAERELRERAEANMRVFIEKEHTPIVEQLRQQLTTEQEETQRWRDEYSILSDQLDAAVEALDEIRGAGYTLTRQDGTNVIDAALAKVKEGK